MSTCDQLAVGPDWAAGKVRLMVELGPLITGLLGGIALFLHGMESLTSSLSSVAGGRMQTFLGRVTSSPLRGAMAGAILTAILQSSSLTTVLCVGFISAGLMNLRQAVGVIVGANVGTTITAQVIAFDAQAIALPLVALGVALRLISRNRWQKHFGSVALGIGLVFYGMELMATATEPLRDYEPFVEMLQSLNQAWIGILLGAAFTALVQSSSATTGLVIVLASQSFLTLEAAIALVLGANIGSCITAVVAAWNSGPVARQAAAVHVVFNVLGAAFWWVFLTPLGTLSKWASGPDIARQVANAHTIFNLSNAVVALLFSSALARLVERLLPAAAKPEIDDKPLFLDPSYLSWPSMALERVRLELGHLGEHAVQSVHNLENSSEALKQVKRMTPIQEAIVDYIRQLSRGEMNDEESHLVEYYLVVCDSLESVGVTVQELVEWEEKLEKTPFLPSVRPLRELVEDSLSQSIRSLSHPELAREVRERKPHVRELRDDSLRKAMEHLDSQRPGVVGRYRFRSGVVEDLRRIYYLASHISKAVLKHAGRSGEELKNRAL
ncbi:MAG: Na/Pi cotransporter family protein [Candidatus Eremiobacteraeota bacterium]|nr:Na/Pi cotransporter family protein [Candidatus Eremiobacteraeota bacterium]